MNNTPQNPVSWFAINVQDLARAARFYETVFGLPLQEVPGKNPQHKMYLFTPAWEQHGIGGMLWHDPAAQPAGQGGITVFFNRAESSPWLMPVAETKSICRPWCRRLIHSRRLRRRSSVILMGLGMGYLKF